MEKIYCLFIFIGIVEIGSSSVMIRQKNKIESNIRMSKIGKENHETFPYSAIVYFNNGCTGTLISCKHILTGAHCVHNGETNEDVEVSLLSKDGKVKLLDVKKIFVPSGWKKNHDREILHNNDYAVVELKEEHNREWMEFGANDADTGTVIQSLAFPISTQDYQVFTTCPIYKQSKNYIYNLCKRSKGISGSAFFISEGTKEEPRIIGILSPFNFLIKGRKHEKEDKEGNIAHALTPHIVKKMIKWIKDADCTLSDEDEQRKLEFEPRHSRMTLNRFQTFT